MHILFSALQFRCSADQHTFVNDSKRTDLWPRTLWACILLLVFRDVEAGEPDSNIEAGVTVCRRLDSHLFLLPSRLVVRIVSNAYPNVVRKALQILG